jgi:hypothetical protein
MRALVATGLSPLPAIPAPRRRPMSIALWLPLTPVLILLAPLALLAAPFLAANRRVRAVSPLRLACGIGALLTSLSGTRIDVDTPDVRVRLRIF